MADMRVPMPNKRGAFIGDGDVRLTSETMRTGQRISMDIADDVWQQATAYALQHAVERLAEEAVYRHAHEIERAVHDLILDRKWAEPIIRQEISRVVERVIRDMLTPQPEDGERER